jgi:pimeloyl-ACP methyl ester carboxylesterase
MPGKAARPGTGPDHITPYDRFAWTDVEVEDLLRTGAHRAELCDYFGAREYEQLSALARRAHLEPPRRGAPRVLIVPGMMGSQLGTRRAAPHPADILWLDPLDIAVGKLARLSLCADAPVVSLGIVLYTYLRLKLHLRAAGFDPVCLDYDWRKGIDALGSELASRLHADTAREIMLVAHSMGGLVARAALQHRGTERVRRLIMLGTPNAGSFAPLQALRGTYSVVRNIAALVTDSTAERLATEVFNGFPSLYDMLPGRFADDPMNLYDSKAWPSSGPQPDARLLAAARTLHRRLAPADERMYTVTGVGQETVTAVRRHRGEFLYTVTRHGDGTVPARSAALPGARNYFVAVSHGELPRDPQVAAGIIDLLRSGRTRRLAARHSSRSRAQAEITDSQLRRLNTAKIDWAGLEPPARRQFLENLNAPPRLTLRVPQRRRAARRKAPR